MSMFQFMNESPVTTVLLGFLFYAIVFEVVWLLKRSK